MNGCSIRRLVAVVAFSCLASVATVTRVAVAIENLKVGETFPDFALRRADGDRSSYTASELRGKPAVVVFWRPGQRLSLEALRDMKGICEEIGTARMHVLAVDAAHSKDPEIQDALTGEQLPFPVVADPKRDLYGAVGIIVSPTTLVLDAKGVLRFVLASHPRTFRQVIRARLRFLLNEINQQEMEREIEPIVLKIDHDLAVAWRMYNLGRRLQAEGKNNEALAAFEDAVARYPSQAEARCALGFMKLTEGDLTAAATQFQSALVHHPTSPLARLGKAIVLARSAKEEEAEPILLSLLGQKSVAARVRYELGRIYQGRGQADRAITFYRNALTVLFPEPLAGSETPAVAKSSLRSPAGPSDEGLVKSSPRPRSGENEPVEPSPVSDRAARVSYPATEATINASHAGMEATGRPEVKPIVPPANATYLGIMGCKKCHYQQWKSWQETKMAAAFEILKPSARGDAKQARNLDPRKDYTSDPTCLPCHTTGYGLEGGYPAAGGRDAGSATSNQNLQGVVCEGCHGPGNKYSLVHKDVQDKRRKYTQQEFLDAGQYSVDERVCAACHNSKGPCIPPGAVFDFAKRKDQGTHKHYSLQFRR